MENAMRDVTQILVATTAAAALAAFNYVADLAESNRKDLHNSMATQALETPNLIGQYIYADESKKSVVGYIQETTPEKIKLDIGGEAISTSSKFSMEWERIKCGSLGANQDANMIIDRRTGEYQLNIGHRECSEPVTHYVNILSR